MAGSDVRIVEPRHHKTRADRCPELPTSAEVFNPDVNNQPVDGKGICGAVGTGDRAGSERSQQVTAARCKRQLSAISIRDVPSESGNSASTLVLIAQVQKISWLQKRSRRIKLGCARDAAGLFIARSAKSGANSCREKAKHMPVVHLACRGCLVTLISPAMAMAARKSNTTPIAA